MRFSAEHVDCSGPWLLWPHASEAVGRSIARAGQLSPVLVDASGPHPLLVDGAARVAFLREQGLTVYGLNVGPGSAWDKAMLYMHANMHRLSQDADKVRALRFFAEQNPEADMGAVLKVLGLVPQSKPARQALAWLDLPRHWDAYPAAGAVPLACAEMLRAWAPQNLSAVEILFQRLSWSRGLIVQVLTWLHEVHERDGCDLDQVLAQADVLAILQADLSPKDAMARIAARIRALRYPELTRLERVTADAARAITSGTLWRMTKSDQFESDAMDLLARVRSRAEMRQAATELSRMTEHTGWDDLWPDKEA